MKFACPYCRHSMHLKKPKIGSFKPKCTQCGKRFRLRLREGEEAPHVAPLDEKTPAVESTPTVKGDVEETRMAEPPQERSATDMPTQLGGYRIIKPLGAGAMGSVYLARQLSLDRDVALKTIQDKWAGNPRLNARFVREAYAAAQLTHHNVVQVYDFGSENDVNFFSMELVNGGSLSDYVRQNGKPDVKTAVGFILQAARGLEFAHQQGMVHRDIKPGNLMITDYGVVKVADLGLVKIATQLEDEEEQAVEVEGTNPALAEAKAGVTLANVGVGTASYMAPEQATDARRVDHRADIYALGCTMYSLLIGRPPFRGTSALEVLSKHRTEPIQRLEEIDPSFPAELSNILQKMVAKRVEDRFANMGEVIAALERFLHQGGPALPSDEQRDNTRALAAAYQASSAARLRSKVLGWLPLAGAALTLLTFFVSWSLSAGLFGLTAGTMLSYFVLHGFREQGPLFLKVREYVATSSWGQRGTWLVALLLLLVAAFVTGVLLPGILAGLLGIAGGVAIQIVLDGRTRSQRQQLLEELRSLLRSLRMAGMNEDDVREFVAVESGDSWEELFEELFGFDAKLKMRDAMRDGRRPRFMAWREPLIRGLHRRIQEIKKRRDVRELKKVEAKGLEDQGVSAAEAAEQAERMAAAVVDDAHEQTQALPPIDQQPTVADPAVLAAEKRARIKAMLAEARGSRDRRGGVPLVGSLLNLCLGARVRFVLGAILLAGCLLWVQRNDLSSAENRGRLFDVLLGDTSGTETLGWPVIGRYFDSLNPGLAGMALLFASLYRGWTISILVIPAAALMLWGADFGIPGFASLSAKTISALAGAVLALVALVVCRE